MRNTNTCEVCKKRAKHFCIKNGQKTCRKHFKWPSDLKTLKK